MAPVTRNRNRANVVDDDNNVNSRPTKARRVNVATKDDNKPSNVDTTTYFQKKIHTSVEEANAKSTSAKPMESKYPTIDISCWMTPNDSNKKEREDTARLVLEQAKTAGSFNFVGHGIEPEFLEKVGKATKDFFDLPLDEKTKYKTNNNKFGYVANQMESASLVYGGVGQENEQKDLREVYSTVYPPDHAENVKGPHQKELNEFMVKLQPVEQALNRIFAAALNLEFPDLELPMDYLQDAQSGATGSLRSSRYPSMPADTYGTANRLLPHSDWSTWTILHAKAGSKGLEEIRDGEWVRVDFDEPTTLHLTIGEVLCMWSNEVFANNVHRVGCSSDVNRISFAYFACQGLPPKDKKGIPPVVSLLKDGPTAKFPSTSPSLHAEMMEDTLFGKTETK